MIKYSLIIILVFLFASCMNRESIKKSDVITDTIQVGTNNEKDKIKNESLNKQFGDTIQLSVKNKEGIYDAIGFRDSIHSRIYVKFLNKNISILKAKVHPLLGEGNLRFNQIIFPDKTADGPFGNELQQKLTQTGEHILIIGISQMAENPYVGKFKVEIQFIN